MVHNNVKKGNTSKYSLLNFLNRIIHTNTFEFKCTEANITVNPSIDFITLVDEDDFSNYLHTIVITAHLWLVKVQGYEKSKAA